MNMADTGKQVGAVILAAGRSSRMGDFKPLLAISGLTMMEHIINKFVAVGCEPIVVVTGREADRLETYITEQYSQKIYFIQNVLYETTEMMDSVKLGIKRLQELNGCHAFFLTTADIPLFQTKTLVHLLSGSGPLRKPSCHKKCGHPVYIDMSLADALLDYQGEQGLKGAFVQSGPMHYVDVEDEGILMDADTKEGLEQLRAYSVRHLVK